ncbi:response regulator [Sphingomonas sp. Leaf231]|uniref:sigma-54-dependent transcriptional regulator n=1 Tax=Sphingomonas sp. Leaf231 TaxID=1736301 RepID=UPI0009EB48EE
MNAGFSSKDVDSVRPNSDTVFGNGHPSDASSGLSILLVDDNRHVAESLGVAMRLAGHRLAHAEGPEAALSLLASQRFDAILLDLNYSLGQTDGAEGLALLARLHVEDPAARIVVITAHSGIRIAVAAMRAGASDFVMKPWRNADLIAALERVARQTGPAPTLAPVAMTDQPARLIGESDAIARVRSLIGRIGPTPAGVVVSGSSGSGRSLVAAALHAASPQAAEPLTIVDLRDAASWSGIAAARSALLLRHPDRMGEVEQDRLRHLLPAAARCISIADRPAAIAPALARRIATVEIAVPPLAARGDDVLILARHFLRLAAKRYGRSGVRLSPAAETALRTADWPDEVRGLAAAIERAVLLGEGDTIHADDLVATSAPTALPAPAARFDLDENERAMIEAALREHRHNVSHAAAALGLSRGALYRRMARHGL